MSNESTQPHPLGPSRAWKPAAALICSLVLATACGSESATISAPEFAPLLENGSPVDAAPFRGLQQTVELRTERLHNNEPFTIRSVVRNVSDRPITVVARTCGLDLRATFNFQTLDELVLCAAYSMEITLRPGDSLVESASAIARDEPGRYQLGVRHLLRPNSWVVVDVAISPR